MRRNTGGRRIGAHQHDDEAGIGHRLQIRLQTTDVVTSTDDDGHDGVSEDAIARLRDRLLHEPMSRKAPAVPREARAEIGDHLRIARRSETPFLYLYEVAGELIEAVRIVAKQIALDDDAGHRACAIARKSRFFEQRRREQDQLVGAIPIRQDA